jgi:uncharacterized protein (TIGR02118 family)
MTTATPSTNSTTASPVSVRFGMINKKPEWNDDAFVTYWRKQHGPLVARLPNLRGYWQNLVVDRLQRGIDYERGPWDFDGLSQLWFDDSAQAQHAFHDSELAAAFVKDELHFLGGLHIVSTHQTTVIEVPEPDVRARLLKRISTLRRRADIDESDFRREWIRHGEFVRRMPAVKGYRQNVVTQRERVKGRPCSYDELPIDGIVELWFESTEALDAAFASPEGQRTMAHARTFLSEITAFLVEEHRVI